MVTSGGDGGGRLEEKVEATSGAIMVVEEMSRKHDQ